MSCITRIDGSIMEGGGQILRLAVSFSSLLKKPININKIRANRAKGGLRPQHLKGIQMACEMCSGTLDGGVINSTEITFNPGKLTAGEFYVDTKTAGSIVLLMQVSVPIALFSPSFTTARLKGGTNADMAPQIDYTINVFLPVLKKFGGDCDCKIIRRGYYPKGGGEVEFHVTPIITLSAVNITSFGVLTRIWGRSYVAGSLPIELAHRMADAVDEVFKRTIPSNIPVDIKRIKESPKEAFGNGSGIVLFAETSTGCILGGSSIGSRNIPAQEVGITAAEELVEAVKGEYCVDQYMQDQIIVLMALAQGKSVVKCGPPTEHTKTAIYIAEKLTDAKFKIEEKSGSYLLQCEGIGLNNEYK